MPNLSLTASRVLDQQMPCAAMATASGATPRPDADIAAPPATHVNAAPQSRKYVRPERDATSPAAHHGHTSV
jgi:hypothetical protein